MDCPLCSSTSNFYATARGRSYHRCTSCLSVFLDPAQRLSFNDEEIRYRKHNNNILDLRYQNFVSPIVEAVIEKYSQELTGLDYGAGPGPVVAYMLKQKGYNLTLFDPYFHNNPTALLTQYNFIVCSEVAEHFYNPYNEFAKLRSLLKPNGTLFCLTDIFPEEVDFQNWHYKNDETHVFFYHSKALDFIVTEFGFKSVKVNGRLVEFSL